MFAISSSALTPRATVANATRTRRSTTARRSTAIRAEAEGAKAAPAAPKAWTAPKLNPNTPSPIFGGSTGGLLRKAQVEEFYVLTWEAKKEAIFEMPTGGAAIMRKGPNLLKLARKEQCLALLNNFRAKMKLDGCIYRVFPSGEVQYLHPKDGVYPEKVNKGRVGANQNMRSIGKNTNPASIKFQGKLGPFEV
ncbi:psaD, PSI-D, subunit II, photosystem I protein [Ostreococcus lucimarinus CCE9901]|uniref:Photosystem I reaction center subunit II, chloroplastic n=1 Tax=Ostreococcus lucimarinus (strain CCE9901) TaxID=436017 RepID=A4S7X2_OSTLU|nr:psaD, PSI-D, subunit II, photosystem I protein [Ostreococcus lucimarinus CCE9901]ABO99643.1 psaD, PSI-D, subunit II, photosystem I protein [Ostreococcus lucimarinus CCE9901]|eukprot:XP_001421350.1 psaD, PSI-D, subunit II, photosystem I protein [Ostreococcus lucimarinus CCE9901]